MVMLKTYNLFFFREEFKMKKMLMMTAMVLGVISMANGLLIDFESPAYSTGPIAGQELWDGNIPNNYQVAANGAGQVLTSTDSADSWARRDDNYDLTGNTVYGFDVKGAANAQIAMRNWGSTYQYSSFAGVSVDASDTYRKFYIRGWNFGDHNYGNTYGQYADRWIRILLDIDEVNDTASLLAWDLTTGASIDTGLTDIALNGGSYGTNLDILYLRTSASTGVMIDNVVVAEVLPIPEPATLAIVGIGALCLRRKRR